MKRTIFFLILILLIIFSTSYGQTTNLDTGKTIEKKLLKNENHIYTIFLHKGEYAECIVMQKGVDVAIDVTDPSGKKIKTFDSPNGQNGPEPVSVEAIQTGNYQLKIYPLNDQTGMPDSLKEKWPEINQGNYSITNIVKLSASQYKEKLAQIQADKDKFAQWLISNAHPIKTVDAGNGFEDLQPFKTILQNARVVGLGEASHGTSEFFRMKHRMLEFLVKEMGFTSFYIEASMTRCRYINDYVLNGKGNLDTATAIQGFVTWRVEEVKNMIEWMRQYNATVPDEKKVKFFGYDLQINDNGWKELKDFYAKVNPEKLAHLDSLRIQADSASAQSNSLIRQQQGANLFTAIYLQCLAVMNDMFLNEGSYEYIVGKEVYEENLMNIKLIVQEIESYKNGITQMRDYYMAQNILYLLNREKPDAKVVVWAHNGHIAKYPENNNMGSNLAAVLKEKYYAIGFEFYSGSFQTRNMDINNKTKNWDVMSVSAPPEESLAWYFNKTGKDKFFIDFRNTGTDKIKFFNQPYQMHSFGSMYSTKWPATFPETLTDFDGMIYIKESTAAKNFTKVYL